MLDAKELDVEIAQREIGPATMQTVEQLALLYIVRDHLYPQGKEPTTEPPAAPRSQPEPYYAEYSGAPELPPDASEFLELAYSVPLDALVDIMDEHMEAVRMLYPKEYNAVLRRLDDARA